MPQPQTPRERQEAVEATIRRLRAKQGLDPDGRALTIPQARIEAGEVYYLEFAVHTAGGRAHEVRDTRLRAWALNAGVCEGIACEDLPPGGKVSVQPDVCLGLPISGVSALSCLRSHQARKMQEGLARMAEILAEGRDFAVVPMDPPKER